MKKIYLMAVLSFIVLAPPAFSQIQNSKAVPFQQAKIIPPPKSMGLPRQVDRVEGATSHAFINYANGDEAFQIPPFYYWIPALYMNTRYTVADTITSPWNSSTANIKTVTNCTVVFDTLWDQLTLNSYSVQSGSLQIDTIWALMAYHNTTGTNDTVIFQVNAVDSQGFPTNGTYQVDTLLLNASTLTYNDFSKLQLVYVVPKTPIPIPSIARQGWNFCINMEVYGSKMDTVGVWYFSKGTDCTGGGANSSAYTVMGVPDGRAPHVNSFVSGLFWYNTPYNHGDGSSLTWPRYSGSSELGMCANSGNYYWFDQYSANCAGDTGYFPEQDIAIYASVDYSDVTGINGISSKKFSISQNYPNPFNKSSEIKYILTKVSDVVFSVYDITGRQLVHSSYTNIAPGQHVISLEANQFAPGIYYYAFDVNGTRVTRKMVITR